MLQDVRQDLSDVVQVCVGKKKQTNYLRTLISDLVKGKTRLYKVGINIGNSRQITSDGITVILLF